MPERAAGVRPEEPDGYNDSRFAAYQLAATGDRERPAVRRSFWLALPDAYVVVLRPLGHSSHVLRGPLHTSAFGIAKQPWTKPRRTPNTQPRTRTPPTIRPSPPSAISSPRKLAAYADGRVAAHDI